VGVESPGPRIEEWLWLPATIPIGGHGDAPARMQEGLRVAGGRSTVEADQHQSIRSGGRRRLLPARRRTPLGSEVARLRPQANGRPINWYWAGGLDLRSKVVWVTF
jgi:hypothetical protein